eukprot:CAMPEP_0174251774 /NCGR_PEP_ID=MMETSP0439-20130205/1493_1 /TAXON_ID=0 /ORGANISM="Stereomyxa ramosa, Strain Chinc5" /LENGTH=167 /DNA_ID=CAMNT_0015332185 /DNA_START=174 /DNA_END=677 /DNA_ORIENTATION=+
MWVSKYDPTIEDSHRKQVVIDEEASMLYILDTAGQEEYETMQDQWFKTGEGFVCVYSLVSRKSFNEIDRLRNKILRIKGKQTVPIVLVGNKNDLVDKRKVSTEEGKGCAEKWGCPFFESSAKNHVNVDEAFEALVREVRRFRLENPEQQPQPKVTLKKTKRINCVLI